MNLNGRLFVQLVLLVLLGVGFSVTTVSLSMADSPTSQPTIQEATPQAAVTVAAAPVLVPTPVAEPPVGRTLRERSRLLDRQGIVVRTGTRLQFAPADGLAPMTLLENRMLERVEQLLRHASRSPELQISGLVTEYHGRNFLLLTRVYVATPAAE